MFKTFSPSSWNMGDEQNVALVKSSSRGIVGADFSVLEKRAGSEFAHKIKEAHIPSDVTPIHLIAMGASDTWGINRNSDGWTRKTLLNDHGNFVKFARWYRNHVNKDPKKSYGHVKLSHFNDDMDRVELLVFLNNNEKAASKYGGLPANEELHLIHANKDIPVSMATKIAYDTCLACGNKAKTRKDYCKSKEEGGTCTKFGCATGLGCVSEDGFVQGVDNPSENYFFDISKVRNPAERTAYGFVADYIDKEASDHVGGAELAEQYNFVTPLSVRLIPITNSTLASLIKTAYKLASIEEQIEEAGFTPAHYETARAFVSDVQPEFDLQPMLKSGGIHISAALAELANHKIAMPFKDFVRFLYSRAEATPDPWTIKTAEDHLPGLYSRLIASPYLEDVLRSDNPFVVSKTKAPLELRKWAEALAPIYSLKANHVEKRAILAGIRNSNRPALKKASPSIKIASLATTLGFNKEAESLARYYGIYKLSVLSNEDSEDMELTAERAILQNYVS